MSRPIYYSGKDGVVCSVEGGMSLSDFAGILFDQGVELTGVLSHGVWMTRPSSALSKD